MATCQICNKSVTFGNNVSFSKRNTNRPYKANIQRARIFLNGRRQQVTICTKCLKSLQKAR